MLSFKGTKDFLFLGLGGVDKTSTLLLLLKMAACHTLL